MRHSAYISSTVPTSQTFLDTEEEDVSFFVGETTFLPYYPADKTMVLYPNICDFSKFLSKNFHLFIRPWSYNILAQNLP